ncbi:MAG: GNAT family N-acetyltransferase [Rhodospirillales bacterium]|nr:GNAT family N-acetyltransferase [Rhodospirillales bacterium]
MVDAVPTDFTPDAWSRLTETVSGLSFVQGWEYGEAKARTGPWRVERGEFHENGRRVGVFQTLLRTLPLGLSGGLAWVNRGPLATGGDGTGEWTAAMLGALARHYVGERRHYLLVAPPLIDGALAPEAARSAGFRPTEWPGWASGVIDLTASLDDLRRGLGRSWRTRLNKAERAGPDVAQGCDEELFEHVLAGHARAVAEKGFATTLDGRFLRVLQELLPPERKMVSFVAFEDALPIGWTLFARYASTAEYIVGGVTETGRRRDANRVLLWRALAAMKDAGVRTFDMGGMDDANTPPGIYDFKRAMGAAPYRLEGELEAGSGRMLDRLVRHRVRAARARGAG